MDKFRRLVCMILTCCVLPTTTHALNQAAVAAESIHCPFDGTKSCSLICDVLNDKTSDGLRYYASTNLNNQITGEINVYDASLVQPYPTTDGILGQISLNLTSKNNNFTSGEIRTRVNLNQPPYNSPVASNPWTTNQINYSGYLEIIAKMPQCTASDDGLCQSNQTPIQYNTGLWPKIRMLPTSDSNLPSNAVIDLAEAYQENATYRLTTAKMYFNGNDSACTFGNCSFYGYPLNKSILANNLFENYHSWGFLWKKDLASVDGGYIISGYLDNQLIWGPITTDNLPADGRNAFIRGFNDPLGGYYLAISLGLGGYAGQPNAHLQAASMYIQSIRVYEVTTYQAKPCQPPTNIALSTVQNNGKVMISWAIPANTAPIQFYQVLQGNNNILYRGPGFIAELPQCTNVNFYSYCGDSLSEPFNYNTYCQLSK